jgi:hypothetical protein
MGVDMFYFVRTETCGMCNEEIDCCTGHGEFNGMTSIDYTYAINSVEPAAYRDAHSDVEFTASDILAMMEADAQCWSIFNHDDVNVISDSSALTVAKSLKSLIRCPGNNDIIAMADGAEFNIVGLISDCSSIVNNDDDARNSIIALAVWAWAKIESNGIICAKCGDRPCYVFNLVEISMEKADACRCGAPHVMVGNQND